MGARPRLLLAFELPFFFVHTGVALIVGAEFYRRNRAFTTSFYHLYLAQSAVDVLSYIAVRHLLSDNELL